VRGVGEGSVKICAVLDFTIVFVGFVMASKKSSAPC
jgi:hypothetical protein